MYRYMGYTDQQKMQAMWETANTAKEIANSMGMQLATVYCELKCGENGLHDKNQRRAYDADLAHYHICFRERL